jgi:hypothetical protein
MEIRLFVERPARCRKPMLNRDMGMPAASSSMEHLVWLYGPLVTYFFKSVRKSDLGEGNRAKTMAAIGSLRIFNQPIASDP